MDNISKILIAQDTGKRVGYLLDVAIDFENGFQKIGYYVVDEDSESEFLMKNENISKIGEEFVLIESVDVLEFLFARKSSLVGKTVLDENCQNYGRIERVDFSKNKCIKIVTSKGEILPKFVKNVGEDVVLLFLKKKKKQTLNSFPKIEANDIVVEIQSSPQIALPEKVTLSSSFYVGKICLEDIFGYNNERIIAKGEKISRAMFENAKKHNKLNQLFFAVEKINKK